MLSVGALVHREPGTQLAGGGCIPCCAFLRRAEMTLDELLSSWAASRRRAAPLAMPPRRPISLGSRPPLNAWGVVSLTLLSSLRLTLGSTLSVERLRVLTSSVWTTGLPVSVRPSSTSGVTTAFLVVGIAYGILHAGCDRGLLHGRDAPICSSRTRIKSQRPRSVLRAGLQPSSSASVMWFLSVTAHLHRVSAEKRNARPTRR
jgi:hypothetical protein